MPNSKPSPAALDFVRQLADQAFARSAGAPLINGNTIDLLFDSRENFPAWETALSQACDSILIETYIFADDAFGHRVREILAEQATKGVQVRLLVDWLGSWKAHMRGFFKPLLAAGAEVRIYNRPSLSGGSPLGRNHRKLIIVDGAVAFISGLGISSRWEGKPDKGGEPWRDTGARLCGPVLQDAIDAFADSWASCGEGLDESLRQARLNTSRGKVAARLIATTPATANLMRLDLLIASFARRSLWLTDAYFMGTSTYLTALQNAAKDGVDVRLLVPRSSDIGWIATVSRTLYRPLLEAGVRVFEWDGPMIHAKTAVADGRWARLGSSNLNLSSWLANREIDVAIEDEGIAGKLADKFLDDLEHATEVRLSAHRHRPVLSRPRQRDYQSLLLPKPGAAALGASAAARQAARIGDALGAAVRGTRTVEASEASSFLTIGTALLALALVSAFFPYLIAGPLALLLVLSGGAVVLKSLGLYRARWKKKRQPPGTLGPPTKSEDKPPADG
ncbi:phosphatidylserine/phosphatidylglycerophosphate/cardiolipin synthase family protein [Pseudogulbenkiania sp. MAI-1]|uniref:phospholipase D-like domain-containing protein n=1 Tax=Pseudogulbenkiania sp. MAI-1 TaxID=990370 RepID=UPI00045E60A0|nr:phosphatidylserine/phosphatidylglycerophosphate/cardiolipin synthase family protein [Pseudogulbenkiania sp. MAI-1]